MSNSFGHIFRITTFGESHGKSVGVVIDGCPAGIKISKEDIQKEMDRRRPGQSSISTPRNEADEIYIQSGIHDGITLGSPILLQLFNKDQRSKDYSNVKNTFRPSHADFTYEKKYGLRDFRGGGRSSARETAARVAAGAIAKKILGEMDISIHSFVSKVHTVEMPNRNVGEVKYNQIENHITRCPDLITAEAMQKVIEEAKADKDTVGGIIDTHVLNVPAGLGEPIYDKLQAKMAYAMMGINAVKGFEYGMGFRATDLRGSEHNDSFAIKGDKIYTETNYSGGIQGGISNGMPLYFRTAFKPVATIGKAQKTIDKEGNSIELEVKGRHDPCVLPRAVPIVDAMTAICLLDFVLLQRTNKIFP